MNSEVVNNKSRRPRRLAYLLGAMAGTVTLLLVTASCAAKDAAGMTRHQAAELPLQSQFELVAERDRQMGRLLADAQRHIAGAQRHTSEQRWHWGEIGVIPVRGPNVWSVRGMGLDNSFHLSMWVWIEPDGATGNAADLEPMLDYFEKKQWPVEVRTNGSNRHRAIAETDDGFIMSWRVKQNGIYNLEVLSKSYWGDSRELQRAVAYRIPSDGLHIGPSLPGERVPFPKWSDPEDPNVNFDRH